MIELEEKMDLSLFKNVKTSGVDIDTLSNNEMKFYTHRVGTAKLWEIQKH